MHLIKALASGIVGAESGTATLYRRGTSTPVGYYTDFEGADYVSASAITLDEYGSAVVYVDELVRVVARDSSSVQVREFTDGAGDANVEVISESFTGTDYSTLLSAASKPTTLRAVLAKWLTSAGSTDFEVDVSGASLSLQAAASAAYGIFFNVKSSVYGALGDGTTDDYAASAAAIAAAAVNGGVVFFPAGTFRTSAALSVPANVSLLGAGAGVSIIKTSHATADVFDYAGSPTSTRFIEGLTIASSVSNSGLCLDISNTEKLIVRDCVIGGSLMSSILTDVATGGTPSVRFEGCRFVIASASSAAIKINGSAREGRVEVVGCTFVTPAAYDALFGIINGSNAFVRDCVFDCSATTSGTFVCCYAGVVCYGSVRGCEFVDPASGTAVITCMALGTLSLTTEWFEEDANIVSPASTYFTLYSYTHSADGYYVRLGTRETRYKEVAVTAIGPTSLGDLAQYGVISVRSTYAGNMAYTASAVGPMGCKTAILIVNGDAATRAITLTTNFKAAASYSLLTNEAMGIEVVAMSPPAGAGWYLTSFSGSDAGSDGYTI